jgi:hypothetical protein
LKQSFGAALGTAIATITCGTGFLLYREWGIFAAALLIIAIAAGISARYEKNRIVPAIVWNLGISILTFGTVYYLIEYFLR